MCHVISINSSTLQHEINIFFVVLFHYKDNHLKVGVFFICFCFKYEGSTYQNYFKCILDQLIIKKKKKNGLYNRTKTCQGSVLIQLDI